jgi:CRP-like cAMP-binding protein
VNDHADLHSLTLIERVLMLAAVPLLAEARTSDLAHLAVAVRERDLERGQVVYRAGDPPDAMHVIVLGRIRFERNGHAPVEMTEGAFGVFGLLDNHPRTWTAGVLAETRILSIDRDAFVDVISDHVSISRGVLRVMAGRLRKMLEEQGPSGGPEDVEIG